MESLTKHLTHFMKESFNVRRLYRNWRGLTKNSTGFVVAGDPDGR